MTKGRDVYAVTGLFGVGLFLVAVLIVTVAIVATTPGDIFYTFVYGVPALVVGAALLWLRRWGLIVGIVGGLVGLMVALEDVDLFLTTPQSFFDFAVSLFALAGALVVLGASVVGTVQYFRGQPATEGVRLHPAFKGLFAALSAAAVVSAVMTVMGTGNVSAAESNGAIVLRATEAKWDMQMIEAPSGQTLRILLKNDDPIMHTFTIYDLDIDKRIGPWSETIIEVPVNEARIYGFICRVTEHKADMSGAIVGR